MSRQLKALTDMGVSQVEAEMALGVVGNNVGAALEWLFGGKKEELKMETDSTTNSPSTGITESTIGSGNHLSLSDPGPTAENTRRICDQCGEVFPNNKQVNQHANKTGHRNFTQLSDATIHQRISENLEKKPSSPGETCRLEIRLTDGKVLTQIFDAKETLEAVQSYINHNRTDGQDPYYMMSAKCVFSENDNEYSLKRLNLTPSSVILLVKVESSDQVPEPSEPEPKRVDSTERAQNLLVLQKQMEEERVRKNKVLWDIECDKRERRADKLAESCRPTATNQSPAATYKSCRLQIRLTNGESLIQIFDSKETLAAVRLYINLHRTDGKDSYKMMIQTPKRVFTEDDMYASLEYLNLPPAAVIYMCKITSPVS